MPYEKGLVVEWAYHAGKVHGFRQGTIVLFVPEFESIEHLAGVAGIQPNKDVSYKDSSSIDRYLVQGSDGKFYAPKATIVTPSVKIEPNDESDAAVIKATIEAAYVDDGAESGDVVSDEFGSLFDFKYVLFAKSDTARAYGRAYAGGIKVILKGGDFTFLRESGAHEDAHVLTIKGFCVAGAFGVRTVDLCGVRELAVDAVAKAFGDAGFETDSNTVASLIYSGAEQIDLSDDTVVGLSVAYC